MEISSLKSELVVQRLVKKHKEACLLEGIQVNKHPSVATTQSL